MLTLLRVLSRQHVLRILSVAVVSIVVASCAPTPNVIEGGQFAQVPPDESGIRVFKGIPYAAPPVGDLRWKAPQPVPTWSGTRSFTEWGPRCYQGPLMLKGDPLNKRMSEDCLYLNVWTPATSANDALPVMVWIHSGFNDYGAGSQPDYDGNHLAKKGVVVVTINYRLDVLGSLAHPELSKESETKTSGNYGLLDQIAALKWVQKNIAAFGGDPKRVTAFGESAGSLDISALLTSPLTKGLITRAIGESGGTLIPFPVMWPTPLAKAEQEGVKFADSLGAKSITELRAKSAKELIDAADKLFPTAIVRMPVVDGYVLPAMPASTYARGEQNDAPLLVGWNANEGSVFLPLVTPKPGSPPYVDQIRMQYKGLADKVLGFYPPGNTPEEENMTRATMRGDQILGYGTWAWAERVAQAGRSPVYAYYFNRRPPGAPAVLYGWPIANVGVYHTAEIDYAFNNLNAWNWSYEADDRRLADVMSSFWTNFAKNGDPNGPGLPKWDKYKTGGQGQVLELGLQMGMRDVPIRDRYEFFDAMYRSMLPK